MIYASSSMLRPRPSHPTSRRSASRSNKVPSPSAARRDRSCRSTAAIPTATLSNCRPTPPLDELRSWCCGFVRCRPRMRMPSGRILGTSSLAVGRRDRPQRSDPDCLLNFGIFVMSSWPQNMEAFVVLRRPSEFGRRLSVAVFTILKTSWVRRCSSGRIAVWR